MLHDLRGGTRVAISGLTGMGGVGKTALALIVEHQFTQEYPDAQIYLERNQRHAACPDGSDAAGHPRLTITDDQAVIAVVLNVLSQSSPMADAARTMWQQTQTIQIKRQEPVLTERGKLMPLYIQRK